VGGWYWRDETILGGSGETFESGGLPKTKD
jgi:hypothetical protein